MPAALNIFIMTPIWVWAILALLIFIGLRASKTRTVFIPKLFIVPVYFILYQFYNLYQHPIHVFLIYSLALIISTYYNFANQPTPNLNLKTQEITIPGNYRTLAILMIFFWCKYVLYYFHSVVEPAYPQMFILDNIVTGTFTGYLFGRVLNYYITYRNRKTQ